MSNLKKMLKIIDNVDEEISDFSNSNKNAVAQPSLSRQQEMVKEKYPDWFSARCNTPMDIRIKIVIDAFPMWHFVEKMDLGTVQPANTKLIDLIPFNVTNFDNQSSSNSFFKGFTSSKSPRAITDTLPLALDHTINYTTSASTIPTRFLTTSSFPTPVLTPDLILLNSLSTEEAQTVQPTVSLNIDNSDEDHITSWFGRIDTVKVLPVNYHYYDTLLAKDFKSFLDIIKKYVDVSVLDAKKWKTMYSKYNNAFNANLKEWDVFTFKKIKEDISKNSTETIDMYKSTIYLFEKVWNETNLNKKYKNFVTRLILLTSK